MRPLYIAFICIGIVAVWVATFIVAMINTFDRLVFDYKFHDFKFNAVAIINEMAKTKQVVVDSYLTLIIENPTWLTLMISDISLELFYNDVLFVKLLNDGNKDFFIVSRMKTTFDRRINVFINSTTFGIIGKYNRKEAIPLKYVFSGKKYGITFSTKGVYNYIPE
jgi:hypothetical protein